MPTVDQLAPATAVSDADETLVSQNGITRKATIAQVHAGLQPQLAVPSGTLLGRNSPGIGSAETVTVGTNLTLSAGILSASAPPLNISHLTAATTINSTDALPLSQSGTLAQATVSQLLAGLQPQITIASGTLLGRQTAGSGSPQAITIGANLTLSGGTLSATGTSFAIAPLPSATIVNVTDQLPLNQAGTLAKATVGQIQAGLQPQISIASGSLLGRNSAGTGGPEAITIGSNLTLSGGVLSGVPTPLAIAPLASATTVNQTDALAISQSGSVVKATVAQITAGLQPQISINSGTLLGRQTTGIGSPQQISIGANLTLSGGTLSAASGPAFSITALPAATTTSNTDLVPVSQSGNAASVTRAQFLTGLQAQISTTSGTLLGRQSAGTGGPETIAIGANLSLSGGTLSAVATPFSITTLPAAGSPSLTDQVIVAQSGSTKASTYAQFMAGLPLVAPLDLSSMTTKATGTTTARGLAARAADKLNVRDFGATLDGSHDDTAAFQAARTAATAGATIFVPAGKSNRTSDPTNAAGNVLWCLNGTTFSDGTTPIIGIGNDVVETFTGGRKFISRQTSSVNDFALVQLAYNVTHSGGTYGNTNSNFLVNTAVGAHPITNSVYGLTSALTSSSGGGGSEGHVALAGYALRTSVPTGVVGDTIWGSNIYAQSSTGLASNLDGSMVGMELDIWANGDDPGPLYHRVGLQVTVGQAQSTLAACVAQVAIAISANGSQNYWKQGVAVQSGFNAAFDASPGTQRAGGAAFRMATGQGIDFSGDAKHMLTLNATGNLLQYQVSAAPVVSLHESGQCDLPTISLGGTTAALLTGAPLVGFDASNATVSGPALRMAAGQTIALEATNQYQLGYVASSGVQFRNGSSVLVRLDGSGNAFFSGVISSTNSVPFRLQAGQLLGLEATQVYTLGYTTAGKIQFNGGTTALMSLDQSGNVTFASTVSSAAPVMALRLATGQRISLDPGDDRSWGWDSTNALSYLVSGSYVFAITSSGFLKVQGTQVVGPRVTGWAAPIGTMTRATLNTGTASLAQVAQALGALIADLQSHGLIGP